MHKTKSVAGKTHVGLSYFFGILKGLFCSVFPIAEDGVSHVSKLYPDLVETPGLKLYFQKR